MNITEIPSSFFFPGQGKFQFAALAVAGLAYFTSGIQSGVNAYILPSIKCSFQLTDSQIGVMNAGFLAGSYVRTVDHKIIEPGPAATLEVLRTNVRIVDIWERTCNRSFPFNN